MILCLIALWRPGAATTQAFFTSQESIESEVLGRIEGATSTIDIALFELRSPRLATAVKNASGRGVNVRLVLDASHRQEDLPAGQVRWLGGKNSGGRGVMHHKFALFDGKEVLTGSFNWTPGAEHANYENALLTDDAHTVKEYGQEFETLWRRSLVGPPPTGKSNLQTDPGRRPKHRSSPKHQSLKSIKIRAPKPVIKKKRKTHTNRP